MLQWSCSQHLWIDFCDEATQACSVLCTVQYSTVLPAVHISHVRHCIVLQCTNMCHTYISREQCSTLIMLLSSMMWPPSHLQYCEVALKLFAVQFSQTAPNHFICFSLIRLLGQRFTDWEPSFSEWLPLLDVPPANLWQTGWEGTIESDAIVWSLWGGRLFLRRVHGREWRRYNRKWSQWSGNAHRWVLSDLCVNQKWLWR